MIYYFHNISVAWLLKVSFLFIKKPNLTFASSLLLPSVQAELVARGKQGTGTSVLQSCSPALPPSLVPPGVGEGRKETGKC